MGAPLTKKRAVLDKRAGAMGAQFFSQSEGETELVLSVSDWGDFGCPDVMTVTIEPGDLLNG